MRRGLGSVRECIEEKEKKMWQGDELALVEEREGERGRECGGYNAPRFSTPSHNVNVANDGNAEAEFGNRN